QCERVQRELWRANQWRRRSRYQKANFPSNGEPEVVSAWQNPAAESGKDDWELGLVETASHLSKQKAAMGGGLECL
ncbi:clathrin assembly At2g25430, partial [Olea europaea subsp. europaea]